MAFDLDDKDIRITGYKLYKYKVTIENLTEGYYVRTKNNGIKRIDTIWKNKTVNKYGYVTGYEWDGTLYGTIKTTDILKFSKNIIDLLEVGDILKIGNDKYEIIFDESYAKLGILIPNKNCLSVRHCSLQYIFSKQGIEEFNKIAVVTREQFNSVMYKVKE